VAKANDFFIFLSISQLKLTAIDIFTNQLKLAAIYKFLSIYQLKLKQ